jgi:hypothetical protein
MSIPAPVRTYVSALLADALVPKWLGQRPVSQSEGGASAFSHAGSDLVVVEPPDPDYQDSIKCALRLDRCSDICLRSGRSW